MLELNNFDNNSNKKEKKQSIIVIVCLSIFTILAIIITVFAIYLTNEKKKADYEANNINNTLNSDDKNNNVGDTSSNLAVKLTDMYVTNGIKIQRYWYLDGVEKTEQEVIKNNLNDINHNYQQKGNYIQIYGLRNTKVQQSINDDIKNKAIEIIKKAGSVDVEVWSNYANVLSLNIIGEENLNYRLDTGEKIKFKDLFIDENSIKTMLTQEVYNNMALASTGKEPGYDATIMDWAKMETAMVTTLQSYLSNPDINFYFTADTIYTTIDNVYIRIHMKDYYDNIAIYKRYLTDENLYSNEYTTYTDCVFSSIGRIEYMYYGKMEQVTDNLFVEMKLYDWEYSTQEERQKEMNRMNDIITATKKIANSNTNKAYVLTYLAITSKEEEISSANAQLYSVNKDYYDKYGKEWIAESNQKEYLTEDGSPICANYRREDTQNNDMSEPTLYYYEGEFLGSDEIYIREYSNSITANNTIN